MMKARSDGDYEPVFTTIYQYWLARAVHAFNDLNIVNLIGNKNVNAAELATSLINKFPAISENYLL